MSALLSLMISMRQVKAGMATPALLLAAWTDIF